jgi:membrane protease YdiL (CAAX protease family)
VQTFTHDDELPPVIGPRGGFAPVLRVVLYILALVVMLFVMHVPLVWLLIVTGLAGDFTIEAGRSLPVETVLWTMLATGIVVVTLAFVVWVDKRPVASLGIRRSGSWRAEIGLGLALGFGLPLLMLVICWSAGWTRVTGLVDRPAVVLPGWLILNGWLMAAVAIGEEVMCRGYILQTLRRGYGRVVALLASSLIFGALHLANPGAGWPSFVGVTVAGLVLGYAYLVTNRLWLPIALHFSWNLALGPVLGFAVSGMMMDSLIIQQVNGPLMWTGGAFGPEAGLLGLLADLAAAAAIWWFARTGLLTR